MPAFFLLFLTIALGVATAMLAARKGYSFWLWIFAFGVIGLIVLAFLPFVNQGNLPEAEAEKRRKTGNIIGVVLSALRVIQIILSQSGVLPGAPAT